MKTFRLIIILVSIFQFCSVNGQKKSKKQKVDTVYVYEKVIVRDTVYIERAVKPTFAGIIIQKKTVNAPNIENRKFVIKKRLPNPLRYGVEAGMGLNNGNAFSEFTDKKQIGERFGFWIEKKFFQNKVSLQLSGGLQLWNSTFNMDATNDETPLSGFYFSENHEPLLFQKFNNKSKDYTISLQLGYEWKKLKLQAGPSFRWNIYKMQFLVPENGVLTKLEDFKSKNNNLGWEIGLQYQFYSHFSVFTKFQYYKSKGMSFTSPNFDFEMYPNSTTFVSRNYFLGLSYSIPM